MVAILFHSEIGLFLFKFGFITNFKAPKIKPNFSGVTFNWIRRAHLNPGLLLSIFVRGANYEILGFLSSSICKQGWEFFKQIY